eukprot:snap_masked-scaffold_7-processed-gene-15.27-mRNA-1 protein AED:1.00 eAED:1.00 QI:0/-1/0/0/-1/1/1/0/149
MSNAIRAIPLNRSIQRLYAKRQKVFEAKYLVSSEEDTSLKSVRVVLKGIGYRAAVRENSIFLRLGYSCEERVAIPQDVNVREAEGEKKGESQKLIVEGTSLHKVTQFADTLKRLREPEVYKLTGVFVEGITKVPRKEKRYPLKQKKPKK